jgi:hypothetical protein
MKPSEEAELGAALLPGPERTLLLRACAGASADGAEAWRQWCAKVGDPAAALSAGGSDTRSLSPMLQQGLSASGADPGPLRVPLRAAATRERERTATMWAGVASVLRELKAAGVDATLIDEVATSQTAYGDVGIRHCHGVQLLIRSTERQAAIETLKRNGGTPPARLHHSVNVVSHPLGAPVALKKKLLVVAGSRLSEAPMLARRRSIEIAGVASPTLAADDLLLSVVAAGLCDAPPGSLQWAVDAHQILTRAGEGFEWERLVSTARDSRLARLLALGVGYLADQLGAPVPERARASMEGAADPGADAFARVAVLRARRRGGSWKREALRPRNAIALAAWAPSYVRYRAGNRFR